MTRSINQLLHRAEYATIFYCIKLWYSTIFINIFLRKFAKRISKNSPSHRNGESWPKQLSIKICATYVRISLEPLPQYIVRNLKFQSTFQ